MELTIDLNKDAIYDNLLSYYDHNYYTLKKSVFGYDAIKVEYYEVSNGYGVAFGHMKEAFCGEVYFDGFESNRGILTVYLD